ncbi:MAG: glycosyltransferase family 39 protein [Sneathiella sp.]|nr:glycosyltransferase family 39 protein [Sneathiella sp.]
MGIGLLLFFLIGLGAHPYGVPSEARYIEIPHQMVQTGDWVTPRLNGVKYFEKPPLFYWIQAAQIELFGTGEFSGRLWTAIFMAALCLVTGVAAYRKYGRAEGILSALVLATCVLGFVSSRIVLLDVPVSFFLCAALFAFMFAIEAPPGRKRDVFLLLMYVCAALATLTKGLIGILIPGMIIGLWILLTGRWKLLREVRLIPGLLLFLVITVPWHILAGEATPEFYRFYFIHEHFERFLTKVHGRYEPPWFFVVILLAGLLPWTAFFFQSISTRLKIAWQNRSQDGNDLYLLLWFLLPLLFFSLSDSKLISYILPIFPVAVIFIARYLCHAWRNQETTGYRVGAYLISATFLVFAVAFPVTLVIGGKAAEIVAPVTTELGYFSLVMAAEAVIILVLLWRHVNSQKTITTMVVFTAIFISSLSYIAPKAATRSSLDSAKPFAELLLPMLKPGDEVVVYAHYYQDLPVYLDRNVTVVNAFGEMTFGRDIEPRTHQWMIDGETFEKRWKKSDHKIYVLLRRKEFHENRFPNARVVLDIGGPNLLVTNQKDGK